MNRRRFLASLGAALGSVALVTKLGQSTLPQLPRDLSAYLTGPDAWYISGMDWDGNAISEQIPMLHRGGGVKTFKTISRISVGY